MAACSPNEAPTRAHGQKGQRRQVVPHEVAPQVAARILPAAPEGHAWRLELGILPEGQQQAVRVQLQQVACVDGRGTGLKRGVVQADVTELEGLDGGGEGGRQVRHDGQQ